MTEKAERTKTKYLVLRVIGGDHEPTGYCTGHWRPATEVEAHSGFAAIQAVADVPGDYRAIPVRNITEQAMGNPPPEPPKLVPVDPTQITIDGFVEPPAVDAPPEDAA